MSSVSSAPIRQTAKASSPEPQARPRRARGARHVDRRDTILRTAARLFAERGFEGTSLDAVADDLGMHKATLYHYIDSKQEVLYQILVQSFGDLDEVIAAVQDKSRPVLDRLRHFALALARAQNNEFGRCLALVGARPLDGAPSKKIRDFQRKLDTTVRDLVKEGVASKDLEPRDPGLVAAMLFGTLNWVPHWYHQEGRLTLDQIVNDFVDMLAHGICTGAPVRVTSPARAAKARR